MGSIGHVAEAKLRKMEREKHVLFAKLALRTKRYDDGIKSIKAMCEISPVLSSDERKLLEKSYKQLINEHRLSLDFIRENERHALLFGQMSTADVQEPLLFLKEYCEKVEKELKGICEECLNLIDMYLMPLQCNPPEAVVLYNRMKGDCYLNLADITKIEHQRESIAELSKKAFKDAQDLAAAHFPAAHPDRLDVALNFAHLYHTIYGDDESAYNIAKDAYDLAEGDMVSLGRDSTTAMNLLKESYTLWSRS